MTILQSTSRTAAFLLSEGNGEISREVVVINATAGKLAAGTLLAKITAANAGVVTAGTNTGNGTFGAVTVGNTAITGAYKVAITAAVAGAGDFSVTDPLGDVIGNGSVATAFSAGGIGFTIADGSTDFAVGDSWTIAVNAGIGEWVPYDDDGANDGRRAATGILYEPVDATETDVEATAIVRSAEVAGALVVGLDDAGAADLLALGIVVRM